MLPRYRAIRFIKVMESGRTRPLLLTCEVADDLNQDIGTFVVKAPGLPEVGDYELFVETLGYLLAGHFGVETPRAALVDIDEDLVSVLNPILQSQNLSIRAGLGFGSELVAGGAGVTGHEHQNPEQLARACDIFCYDLLIQNPDRVSTNPNCLIKNGRYVAFDFNVAFNFLVPLIGYTMEPWEVSKHQIGEKHVFLPLLRGKEIDFSPFINRVKSLSAERLNELLEAIPFGGGRWDQIVNEHMMSIVKNAHKLEIEFLRCLR